MTPAKHALSDVEGTQKVAQGKNSKHEIRNSKQSQMTKIDKTQNKLFSVSVFWIFRFENFFSGFVSDFDIRISDFICLAAWREKIS
jgi:CRISPR/Cas system-associated endonuclease/helicase Cas3